ncbi:hypothetical protein GCM10027062_28890 [Nocardioides hungaricus]
MLSVHVEAIRVEGEQVGEQASLATSRTPPLQVLERVDQRTVCGAGEDVVEMLAERAVEKLDLCDQGPVVPGLPDRRAENCRPGGLERPDPKHPGGAHRAGEL